MLHTKRQAAALQPQPAPFVMERDEIRTWYKKKNDFDQILIKTSCQGCLFVLWFAQLANRKMVPSSNLLEWRLWSQQGFFQKSEKHAGCE